MLEDPGLQPDDLAAALRPAYGIETRSSEFLPSYDHDAASYQLATAGATYFLKVWFGSAPEAPLTVPGALAEAGVPNILAPIPTRRGRPSAEWGSRTLALYPFVRGRNAVEQGLTDAQWASFGATLRAVHDSGLEHRFGDQLPNETFSMSAADAVEAALAEARDPAVDSAAGRRLARFFEDGRGRIGGMCERAREVGAVLRGRTFDRVLCHADIHAANILVADDGGIRLVDWDGPMIAPRERDLLFVIGSRIARRVEPREEALFFSGYGPVAVDRDAIAYYRYERILEDVAVDAAAVHGNPSLTDAARAEMVAMTIGFFAPGGDGDAVEDVRPTMV